MITGFPFDKHQLKAFHRFIKRTTNPGNLQSGTDPDEFDKIVLPDHLLDFNTIQSNVKTQNMANKYFTNSKEFRNFY